MQRTVLNSSRTLPNGAGWWLLLVLCVGALVPWLVMVPVAERFDTLPHTLGSFGRLTGIFGLILYAYNLMLSTRLRIVERLFGGLDKAYTAHHIIGGVALILLAIHPTVLAVQYAMSELSLAVDLLLPKLPSGWPIDQPTAISFGRLAFVGMVGLLVITFYVKLPYHIWLLTHKFLGAAFFSAGLHVLFITSDVSRNNWLRIYLVALIIIGLVAFAYRTLLGRVTVRTYKYKLTQLTKPATGIARLRLAPVGLAISYQPGQFIFVRFPDASHRRLAKEWHPFSISSAPGETVELTVKALGDFTSLLPKLEVGTSVQIEGAFGTFSKRLHSDLPQIWIAGGIGVTPFLSMARSLGQVSSGEILPIDFYYSVKTTSELIDEKELRALAADSGGRFRFFPYISETEGLLTTDYISKKSGELAGKEVFLCGPGRMMRQLRAELEKRGVPPRSIHSEEFALQ